MTIELIANPKTEKYQQLKSTILGQFFPWSWGENTITTDWQSPDYVDDVDFDADDIDDTDGDDDADDGLG